MTYNDESQPPLYWIAESEGAVVGKVERTSRGKYRAIDDNGRTVGTYRTIREARDHLAQKFDSTLTQRLNHSKALQLSGLIALIGTGSIAIVGLALLLIFR